MVQEGLIRARGAGLTGSVGAGGAPSALWWVQGAEPCPARVHCWCAWLQGSLGLALLMLYLRQCLPAPSLSPSQVRWHCPGGACCCGGHSPHSSAFQPLPCKPGAVNGCVPGFTGASMLGICEGAGRWVLLHLSGCGAARTPRAHTPARTASALPWPLPHRRGLWVNSRTGNRLWKHRHDSACWAVGHSLEVVGTSLGLG